MFTIVYICIHKKQGAYFIINKEQLNDLSAFLITFEGTYPQLVHSIEELFDAQYVRLNILKTDKVDAAEFLKEKTMYGILEHALFHCEICDATIRENEPCWVSEIGEYICASCGNEHIVYEEAIHKYIKREDVKEVYSDDSLSDICSYALLDRTGKKKSLRSKKTKEKVNETNDNKNL